MLDEVTKNEIFSYIETAVEDKNFFEYKTDLRVIENSVIYGCCELFVGANIAGKDHNGHNLSMDLLLQIGEKSKFKNTPTRMAYRKQIIIFTKVFNRINAFTKTKKSVYADHIDIIPIPYKLFSTEDREVLIFNGLQEMGYKQHKGELFATPEMTFSVLRAIAKFHAGSFAFRNQNPEVFQELTNLLQPDTKNMFLQHPDIEQKLKLGLKITMDMLMQENRIELKDRLQNDLDENPLNIIQNVLSNVPEEYVMVHGDCWMNNIVTKENNNNPIQSKTIKLIGWQLATVHSPVLDLAYFLYLSHTEKTNENFESYVEYYYMEFCKFMLKCDSDAQKLFPFTTLLDQFLKFSAYPLIMALGGIPLILIGNCLETDKCVCENCTCENCKKDENCEMCYNYESVEYVNLKETLRHAIRDKIIGILELHNKYFRE